jgi:hypothetical protein
MVIFHSYVSLPEGNREYVYDKPNAWLDKLLSKVVPAFATVGIQNSHPVQKCFPTVIGYHTYPYLIVVLLLCLIPKSHVAKYLQQNVRSPQNMQISIPRCSMVLEYLPTFTPKIAQMYGKYSLHGACDI